MSALIIMPSYLLWKTKLFLYCANAKKAGARFTKHLKPKIFLSAIQYMALKKMLGLRCLVKRAPVSSRVFSEYPAN